VRNGPKLEIAIHILDDGRVVFGDLPPDLAQVAEILRGSNGAEQASERSPPQPSPKPDDLQ
jgi:hypothetical protein